jgi:alpha-tubulin suppressor-like RCC1 family protein
MARPGMLDLPLELLTGVFLQLAIRDLNRIGATCKRLRHGDGGLETAEMLTNLPVVSALSKHAFPRLELIPKMRRIDPENAPHQLSWVTNLTRWMRRLVTALREYACPGCETIFSTRTRPVVFSESWVAYLTRCARQQRCREAPLIAAGECHTLFVDATGRLLSCGTGSAVGHGHKYTVSLPTPVAAMAGIRVRSLAAGNYHSIALSWDGRVYSWGDYFFGRRGFGFGDSCDVTLPVLVEGLEDVCSIAATALGSLAVTRLGVVFSASVAEPADSEILGAGRITVQGFEGVRVRCVCAGQCAAFAIGEDGELFSWNLGQSGILGHGDLQDQPLPKRVEALRGVPMSSVSVGLMHAVALAEDGQVYTWGGEHGFDLLGNNRVEVELLSKPVEALRCVHVNSVDATFYGAHEVADTGELWAWGNDTALAMASRNTMLCPSRLRGCGASRWMRWSPALITRWRWRTTEVCTCRRHAGLVVLTPREPPFNA